MTGTTAVKSGSSTSMAERAYSELRRRLTNGAFYPNQRLTEMELVEALSVNRAAVREALARLAQEGLLERRPSRGVIVPALSPRDVQDVLEMRIRLETLVAAWACERKTAEQSELLRSAANELAKVSEQDDSEAYAQAQAKIHHLLLDMANSSRLTSAVQSLSAQTSWIRIQSLRTPGRLQESAIEHQNIVEAVLNDEPEKAAAQMERHLRNVQDSALLFSHQNLPTG